MKITFKYEQTRSNVIRFSLRNGADSSTCLKISGLKIPQVAEKDFASLGICEGDEGLVRAARKGLVDLLATRWGLCQISWGRNLEISTNCGVLRGRTSSTGAFYIDEVTGDVVIDGFNPTEYEGAYNAYGAGDGLSLEKSEGDWEIESVESTLGIFPTMEAYEAARETAPKGEDGRLLMGPNVKKPSGGW